MCCKCCNLCSHILVMDDTILQFYKSPTPCCIIWDFRTQKSVEISDDIMVIFCCLILGTFYRVDLILPVSSSHLRRAGLMVKRENQDYLQQLKGQEECWYWRPRQNRRRQEETQLAYGCTYYTVKCLQLSYNYNPATPPATPPVSPELCQTHWN